MSSPRWQHLDRRKPAERGPDRPAVSPGGTSPPESSPRTLRPPSLESPAVRAAWGYFQLGQCQPCADLLREALADGTPLPGARRLLGLALGRLGEPEAAARELARAVDEEPDDPELRASLLSAQLQCGDVTADPPEGGEGPAAELAGARAWLLGQRHLRSGRPAAGAACFAEAADRFRAASPADSLEERLRACYVGQVIAHLDAGQIDAAQQCFSRLPEAARAATELARFARELFELAEAVRPLSAAERREALRPLVELIARARFRLRFYDQVRPVAMHWENLP